MTYIRTRTLTISITNETWINHRNLNLLVETYVEIEDVGTNT